MGEIESLGPSGADVNGTLLNDNEDIMKCVFFYILNSSNGKDLCSFNWNIFYTLRGYQTCLHSLDG